MLVTAETYGQTIRYLNQQPVLTVDLETDGLKWKNHMVGIAVRGGGESYYFPFRHAQGYNLPYALLGQLIEIISQPGRTYLGFNFPFDLKMLSKDGGRIPPDFRDVQNAVHLMNQDEPSMALKALGDRYLGPDSSLEEAKLLDKLRTIAPKAKDRDLKGMLWKLPSIDVAPYACSDVDLTEGLFDFYRSPLSRWKMDEVFDGVNAYSNVLVRAEVMGMQIEPRLAEQYIQRSDREMEELVGKIAETTQGWILNPNSTVQVCRWFEIEDSRMDTLKELVEDYGPNTPEEQVATWVLEFRAWAKCKTSYFIPYLMFMDEYGVLHTNMWTTGTYTGRLSCSGPNLQAVPRQGERESHQLVKNLFVARPGYLLLEADYSQAEMRLASFFGRERRMAQLLMQGADIHQASAVATGMNRSDAKRLNFSVIYGIGAKTFSENVKMDINRAKGYLDKYHSEYPGFRRLYREMEQIAREQGYIRLFTGRIRRFPGPPREVYHKASSNLVQGTVAEMIREAMLRIDQELPEVRQLLQIHDSVVSEIPEGEEGRIIPHMRKLMEDFPFFPPPKIDVKIGPTWGSMKKVA